MAQVGEASGALDQSEYKIINNLLNFEKLTVRDIMTPKTVIFMGQADQKLKAFF